LAFQLPHLRLQLLDLLGVAGGRARTLPGVDVGLLAPAAQGVGVYTDPRADPLHRLMDRQLRVLLTRLTSRIALSRNSGGYFLGAGMILILSGIRPSIRPGAVHNQISAPSKGSSRIRACSHQLTNFVRSGARGQLRFRADSANHCAQAMFQWPMRSNLKRTELHIVTHSNG
jgi:hypothetical protein